ncbi:MAG: hypothetical protein M3Y87_35555 [Myxococcota bacterium]|nr:hypothetical protein [Myxococcota bacterium]
MNLNQEIDSRIQRFVTELNELVRRQALQAVSDALGTNGAPLRRGPGRPPGSGRTAQAASAGASGPKAGKVRARRKGEKRTPAELAQLESSLESHVQSHPGQGIEAIGKSLGIATGELSRPMKKLVQRGSVRTEGAKRATKYYAANGASSGSSAAGEATPKRRGPGRKKAAGRKKSKKR